MQKRTLKSYKKKQFQLVVKLLFGLTALIFLFSGAYFFLSQCASIEKNGIYLDQIPAEYLESLYYSVVTITTLGYGDFTPLGHSRLLSSVEALIGLLFVGFAISQVVSVKQDASIEYILKSQIIQNYTGLLNDIRDARAAIKDAHSINLLRDKAVITNGNLIFSNPLYSSVISLQKLNGYTKHIEEIEMIEEIEDYLNRAATYIEELSSMIKKYINYVNDTNKNWKTKETQKLLKEIITCLENFFFYIKYTKYDNNTCYKGHSDLSLVINKTISDLREISS